MTTVRSFRYPQLFGYTGGVHWAIANYGRLYVEWTLGAWATVDDSGGDPIIVTSGAEARRIVETRFEEIA